MPLFIFSQDFFDNVLCQAQELGSGVIEHRGETGKGIASSTQIPTFVPNKNTPTLLVPYKRWEIDFSGPEDSSAEEGCSER